MFVVSIQIRHGRLSGLRVVGVACEIDRQRQICRIEALTRLIAARGYDFLTNDWVAAAIQSFVRL